MAFGSGRRRKRDEYEEDDEDDENTQELQGTEKWFDEPFDEDDQMMDIEGEGENEQSKTISKRSSAPGRRDLKSQRLDNPTADIPPKKTSNKSSAYGSKTTPAKNHSGTAQKQGPHMPLGVTKPKTQTTLQQGRYQKPDASLQPPKNKSNASRDDNVTMQMEATAKAEIDSVRATVELALRDQRARIDTLAATEDQLVRRIAELEATVLELKQSILLERPVEQQRREE